MIRRFKPSVWERPSEKKETRFLGLKWGLGWSFLQPKDTQNNTDSNRSDHHDRCHAPERQRTTSVETSKEEPPNVEEVWFAGCHCGTTITMGKKHNTNHAADIGGGSVPNNTRHSLARIPLRWMIRECYKLDIGIRFHEEMFKVIGINPDTLNPKTVHDKRPPIICHQPHRTCTDRYPNSEVQDPEKITDPTKIYDDFKNEELEDLADVLSPVYDQLCKPWWWIPEVILQSAYYQDDINSDDVKDYT
jgi:hypothetical protein